MYKVRLVKPIMKYKKEALDYIEESLAINPRVNGAGSLVRLGSYEAFLLHEEKLKSKSTLPLGSVLGETLYLVNDEDVVIGMINLRYELNGEFGKKYGHIGYSIRPKFRNQGYAVIQLKLVLDLYRKKGFKQVMLSTSPDNIGSQKVIIACGGYLFETLKIEDEIYLKYWIIL